MKFIKIPPNENQWYRWFAWYPVTVKILPDGAKDIRFFEMVEKCWEWKPTGPMWSPEKNYSYRKLSNT